MKDEPTLTAMALGERATVGDDDVRLVIDELMKIIKNPKANYRSKTAAARALLQYRRVNLDAIRTAAACEMADFEERLEAMEEQQRDEQANY
jgi:hypothetical protein